MDDPPDNRELAKRFDLLKKDFEIMQANVNSTLNEMRANVNSTLNEMRADMAQRDAARAERDTARSERDTARSERDAARSERDATARWWQTAILIAALGIGLTAFGFLTAPH